MKKYKNFARALSGKEPIPYYMSEQDYNMFQKLKSENKKLKIIIKEMSTSESKEYCEDCVVCEEHKSK